ncbi:MAG: hypothetical protein AAGF24_02040 [Cyanobacteria bacterium P01_H01_bin.121]
MNPNPFKRVNLQWSGGSLRFYLLLLAFVLFLGGVLPRWFLDTISTLIILAFVTPIIGFLGLRWWLRRNLIQATCPVCQYPLTAMKATRLQCPNCAEMLSVQDGTLKRDSPPGTIDVDVVELPQD